MSQENKDKKDVKVQDLAPKKDAKGGGARFASGAQQASGATFSASGDIAAGNSLAGQQAAGQQAAGQQAEGGTQKDL